MEFTEVGDYFFKNEKLHDVHFLVGDMKEKIGAVRNQLINQSQVWWAMLSEDSAMVEKNDIHLPDIQPNVFMLLLKHCYGGLNDMSKIPTDLVVSLCYCANKYLMTELMNKISKRLQPTSVDDLFPALHCLNVFNLTGVENSVQKLVQTKTRKIFAHTEFLECHEDSVTFIARQEPLECDELELWQAVLAWAKNKGSNCSFGTRSVIMGPLKHIRLLTLSLEDLCGDVFQSKIFTGDEIAQICSKKINFPYICGIRKVRCGRTGSTHVVVIKKNIDAPYTESSFDMPDTKSSFAIVVKNEDILLKSFSLRFDRSLTNCIDNLNQFEDAFCEITVKITHIIDLQSDNQDEPIVIPLRLKRPTCINPTQVNGKSIRLKANSKYIIHVESSREMASWMCPDCSKGHEFNHGTFFCSETYIKGVGISRAHVLKFAYQQINK